MKSSDSFPKLAIVKTLPYESNGSLAAVSRTWEKDEIPFLKGNGMAEKDSSEVLLLGLGFGGRGEGGGSIWFVDSVRL